MANRQPRGFKVGHNGGPPIERCECGWLQYSYTKDERTVTYCLNRECPHYVATTYFKQGTLPAGATVHRN